MIIILSAKAIEDQIQFYAERLHDCFEGLGTNDTQLIRIVVSRSEVKVLVISVTLLVWLRFKSPEPLGF